MERQGSLPLAIALRASCERQTVILDYESTRSTATTRGLQGELPLTPFYSYRYTWRRIGWDRTERPTKSKILAHAGVPRVLLK